MRPCALYLALSLAISQRASFVPYLCTTERLTPPLTHSHPLSPLTHSPVLTLSPTHPLTAHPLTLFLLGRYPERILIYKINNNHLHCPIYFE